jgi:hypothetical protein
MRAKRFCNATQRRKRSMEQKIVGMVGAVAGLATLGGTQATAATVSPTGYDPARSYAELLDPIPNALALLQAADSAARTAPARDESEAGANVQLARYDHHHHHHHHHRFRHHHHHHHLYIRRRYHHHHHHHRYY